MFCYTVAMSGGCIRGEALYTPRGCWYVCYPTASAKFRMTNFREDELSYAERTVALFRSLSERRIEERACLMQAGAVARTLLRTTAGATDADVLRAALAALGKEPDPATGFGDTVGEDPESPAPLEDEVRAACETSAPCEDEVREEACAGGSTACRSR